MTIIKSILRRLRSGATEQEIEDELRFHIQMRTRESIASGMPPEEAEADALRRFGDFDRVRAECNRISQEKWGGIMTLNTMKGIALMMFGCGLTLFLTSNIHSLRQVGSTLMVIACLWMLYMRFRSAEPDQERINQHLRAGEQMPLGIVGPANGLSAESNRTIASRDEQDRTPVERLMSDDE